jgi:hypothetical protein
MRFEEDDIGGCSRRGHVTTTLCEYGVVLRTLSSMCPANLSETVSTARELAK